MKSMTGFGRSSNAKSKKTTSKSRASTSSSGSARGKIEAEIDVSVKAVNGRFLEIRFHGPREYAGLEGEMKSLLAEVFSRGTVDLYINRKALPVAPEVAVNLDLAKAWLKGFRDLSRTLGLKGAPTLEMLSRVPEIFKVDAETELTEAERKEVKRLLLEAAKACDLERAREGNALRAELRSLCVRLEQLAEAAQSLKGEAQAELEKRLRVRLDDQLAKRGFDIKLDDQRIAHEIVIYLDKVDISEELSRLKEHLRIYRQLLESDEPQGKKLDFYAQELLREVNTIGSKSHIAKLTQAVVEAKTLVEKIREQVQNVE